MENIEQSKGSGAAKGQTGQPPTYPQDAARPSSNAPVNSGNDDAMSSSDYAAGSEGWDDSQAEPSVTQQASSPDATDQSESSVDTAGQSDASLSKSADDGIDDGRFYVAEEVNLDQQSDTARQVGKMPQDAGGGRNGGTPIADAVKKSMQQNP